MRVVSVQQHLENTVENNEEYVLLVHCQARTLAKAMLLESDSYLGMHVNTVMPTLSEEDGLANHQCQNDPAWLHSIFVRYSGLLVSSNQKLSSVCLSVCLSVRLSVCLPACPSGKGSWTNQSAMLSDTAKKDGASFKVNV